MVRDTVAPPARRGAAGVPRRRALLRRLPRQPRLRARGAAHGVRRRRRGDRAVRHQRRDAAGLGRRRRARRASRRPACGSASTATTTPAARSPTRWPPSTRARPTCRARINGYGERTGNADLVSVVANLELKLGPAGAAAGAARARRPGSRTPSPRSPTSRRASRQPYVGTSRVRAQGRAARERDQGRPEPLPAHRPGRRRQRHAAAGLRHGRPGLDRAEGPRARLRPRPATATWSPGSPSGSRSWRRAGYTFEAADASFELLLVEEVEGARPSYFDVESWRVITETRPGRRRGGLRGDGEAARPTASASSSPARATARSTRSTRRCARRSGRPTRRSRSSS